MAEFSITPSTAWGQGVADADGAYHAYADVDKLDLGAPPGIAYANIDQYTYTGPQDACDQAIINYIGGWDTELHNWGMKAGVYGSTTLGYVMYWYVVNGLNFQAPDDIWLAAYPGNNYNGHDYTTFLAAGANGPYVFDPTFIRPDVPDQYWFNDQRVWQYNVTHGETWGGVTLGSPFNTGVDSDCVDADVLGPNTHTATMYCAYPYR